MSQCYFYDDEQYYNLKQNPEDTLRPNTSPTEH